MMLKADYQNSLRSVASLRCLIFELYFATNLQTFEQVRSHNMEERDTRSSSGEYPSNYGFPK